MTVFEYAEKEDAKFRKKAREYGFEPLTSFYHDTSAAEFLEMKEAKEGEIKSLFEAACKSYLSSYRIFNEIILCLNWKSFELGGKKDKKSQEISKIYRDLYNTADSLFCETYKDNREALNYYYGETDEDGSDCDEN